MTNRFSFVGILLFAIDTVAIAQFPDLVAWSGSFSPNNPKTGSIVEATVAVKNIGVAKAFESHVSFFISPTSNIKTDGQLLGSIVVEPLLSGQTSELKELSIPLPPNMLTSFYFLGFEIDPYEEVDESDENNFFYLPSTLIYVSPGTGSYQRVPYPFLLIHGLVSNDKTWDSVTDWFQLNGWSSGGRFDFCLNEDGDLLTGSNTLDYRSMTDTASLVAADFYTMNFDVDPVGFLYDNQVQSNQSAIVKQGKAVRDAIKLILQKTKKDKVILIGHSMGGLASREYLQNQGNWQSDGKHHVAKLLTVGTPHGGSNASTFGGIFTGIDGYSEAVRDLRYSYSNEVAGVYLYGGNEISLSGIGFHNIDVNCNGVIGDNIVGLNQKSIPNDLAYSCVIGKILTGDLVVDAERANLNNYYSLQADTFLVNAAHWNLTSQTIEIMEGIDEPPYFQQAYDVSLDSLYFGVISRQSDGAPYYVDYDDYKFDTKIPGSIRVVAQNISTPDFSVEILDTSYSSKLFTSSKGLSKIDTSMNIPPGKYFFEIAGLADQGSWQFPYAFKLNFSPATFAEEISSSLPFAFQLDQNFPNPFNPTTTISFSISKPGNVSLKVYDVLGREINQIVDEYRYSGNYSVSLDASQWSSGVYFYRLVSSEYVETKKMILAR